MPWRDDSATGSSCQRLVWSLSWTYFSEKSKICCSCLSRRSFLPCRCSLRGFSFSSFSSSQRMAFHLFNPAIPFSLLLYQIRIVSQIWMIETFLDFNCFRDLISFLCLFYRHWSCFSSSFQLPSDMLFYLQVEAPSCDFLIPLNKRMKLELLLWHF